VATLGFLAGGAVACKVGFDFIVVPCCVPHSSSMCTCTCCFAASVCMCPQLHAAHGHCFGCWRLLTCAKASMKHVLQQRDVIFKHINIKTCLQAS
jgi:hypothetical protein